MTPRQIRDASNGPWEKPLTTTEASWQFDGYRRSGKSTGHWPPWANLCNPNLVDSVRCKACGGTADDPVEAMRQFYR